MKKFLLMASIVFGAMSNSFAQSIEVDGKKYEIADVQKTPSGYINEYLLPGTKFDNYTYMIGVHIYENQSVDAVTFAKGLGQLTKKINPQANYSIMQNKEKGEVFIDFVTWDTKNPGPPEFNIFKIKSGPGKSDLTALQYVYKVRKDEVQSKEDWAKEFAAHRVHMLKVMIEQAYPAFIKK